jgi:hypothetical protein
MIVSMNDELLKFKLNHLFTMFFINLSKTEISIGFVKTLYSVSYTVFFCYFI